MTALQGFRLVHHQRQVHEGFGAASSHAHVPDRAHARDLGQRRDTRGDVGRHGVEQIVDGLLAQSEADQEHHQGDAERCHGVGLGQPGNAEVVRGQHAGQAEQHDQGGPDVGGKVQGIGFQGLAVVTFRHPHERARTRVVHGDRENHDQERPQVGVDMNLHAKNESLDRLFDDPRRSGQQEGGFKERRKILDLPVPISVFRIGGAVADPDRPQGHQGGGKVEPGVEGFGQDTETSGPQADGNLGPGQEQGRQDRKQRDAGLLGAWQARAGDVKMACVIVHGARLRIVPPIEDQASRL